MNTDPKPTLRARVSGIIAVVRQLGVRKTVTMLAGYWSRRVVLAIRRPNA
jgi:hypothetical protein